MTERQDLLDALTAHRGFLLQTAAGLTDEQARRTPTASQLSVGGIVKHATLPDLDAAYPLPAAPWFPPGATRSVRRTIVHIIGETAQHAGHADIIRETIDGAKSMG